MYSPSGISYSIRLLHPLKQLLSFEVGLECLILPRSRCLALQVVRAQKDRSQDSMWSSLSTAELLVVTSPAVNSTLEFVMVLLSPAATISLIQGWHCAEPTHHCMLETCLQALWDWLGLICVEFIEKEFCIVCCRVCVWCVRTSRCTWQMGWSCETAMLWLIESIGPWCSSVLVFYPFRPASIKRS